ncbi:MAG: DNA mismatch repair protein MutS [Flavobacterium sp. BFFFF2]|nr:MAG: DNA mismatch repair protein MutS [Flavobacterium sp. BFFFF2]
MIGITEKTLQDLEFTSLLHEVAARCVTETGHEKALSIQPFADRETLMQALHQTNEYVASFSNMNAIPAHQFDSVAADLPLMAIENSYLEVGSFKKIGQTAETVKLLKSTLKKFEVYYPALQLWSDGVPYSPLIKQSIDAIIDKYGELKDNASPDLLHIRREIQAIRSKINQSFGQALRHHNDLGHLDDIRETVVENKRVLAVLAMYRRKVKGSLLGQSKTGSIAYIEPEATHVFTRELDQLQWNEREEIIRILRQLTNDLRPYIAEFKAHEAFLAAMDVVAAKAHLARDLKAILPKITESRRLFFREAYHPILWLTNQKRKEPVHPLMIGLDETNRIIVISGPNAGGKTIALKTVGLLQLMLQCGMLIPVHERSETCLFDRILTDIGDNQSIENHLSTYSYRLKNMNYFLRKCNEKTLFLIDEFGTGTDPELGGALAETFLEEFYHRQAFGIITTHYTNLKMLANELPFATNANMLFDEESLEPRYKLMLGQAGSSFTFEVAQKMGIPLGLVNRAKKKIEGGKVRFDQSIAALQKERNKLEKNTTDLKEVEEKARTESQKLEQLNNRLQDKLARYQELYDAHQRLMQQGQKWEELVEKYSQSKDKKEQLKQFAKQIEQDIAKRQPLPVKEKKKQEIALKVTEQEMMPQVAKIREEKAEVQKQVQLAEANKPKPILRVGDRVRMIDGKSVGNIDHIKRDRAVVNYGLFTSQVNIDQLELVERVKK